MVYNPSLHEEPRNKRAAVIPLKQESSILDWLEGTGRLRAREDKEIDYSDNEEEIAELMGAEDNSFDLDDDDDLDPDE
jgi:hypothetical protein